MDTKHAPLERYGCHITLVVAQKISEKNERALVYFFSPGLIQGKSNKNSIEGTVSDLPMNVANLG